MADYEAFYENDVIVSLTKWEMMGAMQVGIWMREESLKDGRKEYADKKKNGVDGQRLQMIGSLAERAAAKALDLYWAGSVNTFKLPDLSHQIEVRLIGVDHYGLRVRDSDHDDLRIVGVVMPEDEEHRPYRIPGWIVAGDAKNPEWKMNPYGGRPMYAVPQCELRPLRELQMIVLQEKSQVFSLV